jgi:hypothetical protein
MDIREKGIDKEFLFSEFGLCPDYKIVQVDGEWVEFYEPSVDFYSYSPRPQSDDLIFPKTVRLHLDNHLVEMKNGLTLSARFAVSHENKIIFLQVTPMGEFGNIMSTYK